MRLGIIGLPGAGKTTVFNALTGSALPVGVPSGDELRTATVDIPDARLRALSELYQPAKTTHAKLTLADLGGLRGSRGQAELPGPLLDALAAMEAFILVLRAFPDPQVAHIFGSVDPARDLDALETEFLVQDMLRVDARQARLLEERQKGAGDRAGIDRQLELLGRLASALGEERPLRQLRLSKEDEREVGGLGLLSRKPALALVNLGEGQSQLELARPIPQLCMQAKIEMEIGQLPPEDAEEFRVEYAIAEPGLARLSRASLDLLRQLRFYTVSQPEVRAWLLPEGATALEAAGQIHSDLARGFIRAEVIPWQELLDLGGLTEARARGTLRVEGKDYRVSDGDVIYIRFNL